MFIGSRGTTHALRQEGNVVLSAVTPTTALSSCGDRNTSLKITHNGRLRRGRVATLVLSDRDC
jgi:hypothetical protein